MKIHIYDLGYGIAFLIGKRVFKFHLPFPLTRKSRLYILKRKGKRIPK